MQIPSTLFAFAIFALAGAASAAEITLWQGPAFHGRSFSANQSVANFADVGFNDRASSLVVRDGTWQVCSDAYYRGRCVTLRPGEYGSLRAMGLDNAVSSIRELGGWGGGGGGGPGGGARVVLFEGGGFSGRRYDVNGPVSNFDPLGFNDRARSMIVNQGTWELCADAQYRGYCQRYGPGRYANLGPFAGQLSSMRPEGPDGPDWGGGPRAILYEGASMSGHSFVIGNQVMANLAGTGFNDRASSLRVEGGYFLFCTNADFGGECRTFGPGDYPTLPPAMNNRISSGRRINQSYPYNAAPNWNAPPQTPAPQTDFGMGGR
jgi:hypothetical protein